ncbi:MAG: protein-L-isoaspartate(D-aspartate) O-methyltransferase [Terriglobia bacterium]
MTVEIVVQPCGIRPIPRRLRRVAGALLLAACAAAATSLSTVPWPGAIGAQGDTEETFRRLRAEMVRDQIAARGVREERVLEVMRDLPRHWFVPPSRQAEAYADKPLSIGDGQTISQPYIVGLMTELLRPEPDDVILEIGTGSGYQAAVLARLARQVYTIEIIPRLAHDAERRLAEMGFANVQVKAGDGYLGWPEYAPFDRIIVTAAPPEIPPALLAQLKRGGRMVLPVGKSDRTQQLLLLEKSKTSDEVVGRNVIPVRFVPMVEKPVTSDE